MDLITGNKFKNLSNYSIDEFGFTIIREPEINEILKIFVKIDFVHYFFNNNMQNRPYILITHNGDISVSDEYLKYMDTPNLIKWYGQNINTIHPKLQSIPIGIANEKWIHGNEDILFEVLNFNLKKERLVYVNFDINTNRIERNYCITELNKKGLFMENKLPFKEYLEEVSKSYFVVSPNGNGIDCHKTWESLYLKSIPIVTKSINIDFYNHLPIIIINNWSEFNPTNFNKDLYDKIWGNFDLNKLNINEYIK